MIHKITYMIKKFNAEDPWILANNPSVFTQEELDLIVTPYNEFLKNFPGKISSTINDININTKTIEICFSSLEDLYNYDENDDEIKTSFLSLRDRKMNELNISYELIKRITLETEK